MPDDRQKSVSRWNVAGVTVVTLAVVMMAAGLYFAIGQAQTLSDLRNREALTNTDSLRNEARERMERTVTTALADAGRQYRAGRMGDPFGGRREPRWLQHVFIWDGATHIEWYAGGDHPVDSLDHNRLETWALRRLRTRLIAVGPDLTEPSFRFISDRIGDNIAVMASLVIPHESEDPIIAGVTLDLNRLKSELLDPHFASAEKAVQVVILTSRRRLPWSRPIAPFLRAVRVQLRPEFVAAQTRTVGLQIVVYVVITIVAVVALLVMMWILVRRVRREVELSRLKSAFVADVSHELKTPLALIRMFAETLLEGRAVGEEKKREYYKIITRESTRLTHLIDNILDFSRVDLGRKEYDKQTVDVGEIVRDTYAAYRHELDREGFIHALTVADDLPRITGAADAIAQAVVNLVSNAMKYSPDEKSLTIDVACETRRGRHGVLISVKDRGIGIRPEDRAHLFEGFFRAADERVRNTRGAGLGLALVKQIVDAHQGSIDVESRLVKGTTFRIFLPES